MRPVVGTVTFPADNVPERVAELALSAPDSAVYTPPDCTAFVEDAVGVLSMAAGTDTPPTVREPTARVLVTVADPAVRVLLTLALLVVRVLLILALAPVRVPLAVMLPPPVVSMLEPLAVMVP